MKDDSNAPAPQAATPRRSGHSKLVGRPLDDDGAIELKVQAEAPRPSAPEKVSLSEAIWRTGGGSGEFRHRLGIKLGHIKPDEHKTNEHPYSCTCEQCESENAKRESRPSAEEVAWMIHFDDAEMKDEVFTGEGAAVAARARYEQLLVNWNCHLFVEWLQERITRP